MEHYERISNEVINIDTSTFVISTGLHTLRMLMVYPNHNYAMIRIQKVNRIHLPFDLAAVGIP